MCLLNAYGRGQGICHLNGALPYFPYRQTINDIMCIDKTDKFNIILIIYAFLNKNILKYNSKK